MINKPKANISYLKGRTYYKTIGLINIISGYVGMFVINGLLRDKGIIPEVYVWIGLMGFALVGMYGFICIAQAMFSNEP